VTAEPYWADDMVTLHLGDCIEVMAAMETASIDAIVCDPPYGLEFMGKDWDSPWRPGDGINADAGFSDVGMADGGHRLPRPSFTGSTNPSCLECGGTRRGRRDGTAKRRVCVCAEPRFPNVRAAEMQAFQAWCGEWAAECLRILKPGGYLLAFGGTRTWHRLTCAIEDAGFEIRDCTADLTGQDAPGLIWAYGSGFPKSLDVGKAIDMAAGAEREVIGEGAAYGRGARSNRSRVEMGYRAVEVSPEGGHAAITAPATEDAARWEGWGTALKPGWEPIVVARKPLAGTVAANVLAYGTGALNIDGCRVAHASAADRAESEGKNRHADFGSGPRQHNGVYQGQPAEDRAQYDGSAGRWPPNVLLGEEAAAEMDRQSGVLSAGGAKHGEHLSARSAGIMGDKVRRRFDVDSYSDPGGASRFFPVFRYEAKAPASERPRLPDGTAHPTVKPLDLMRWLVRLVTPPGGTVLDCFAGSGTTAEACVIEGFPSVLIEQDPSSAELIKTRLRKPIQPGLFGLEAS
jgi:DNA modification methylase